MAGPVRLLIEYARPSLIRAPGTTTLLLRHSPACRGTASPFAARDFRWPLRESLRWLVRRLRQVRGFARSLLQARLASACPSIGCFGSRGLLAEARPAAAESLWRREGALEGLTPSSGLPRTCKY